MSRNIFNISQEHMMLFDKIEELEGEMTPEIVEALRINEDEAEAKLTAYAYIVKQAIGDITTIKEEKERLDGIIKTKENAIKRMKAVMLDAVNLFGVPTKSGGRQLKYTTLNMYTGSTKALKVEPDFFNIEYFVYTPNLSYKEVEVLKNTFNKDEYFAKVAIDEKRLKDDLIAGVVVPDAEVVTNTHLVIR